MFLPHLETLGYYKRQGNRFVTEGGHIVVPGPGYPNSPGNWGPLDDLEDPDSGATSGDGEAFIFITGRIEAAEPHVEPATKDKSSHHARMNEFVATARAITIARFDPCCVFAALATIPGAA